MTAFIVISVVVVVLSVLLATVSIVALLGQIAELKAAIDRVAIVLDKRLPQTVRVDPWRD